MIAPHPNALPLWVVYEHPADYPQHFVLRVVWVVPGFVMAAFTGCLYDRWEEVQFDIESFGLRQARQV